MDGVSMRSLAVLTKRRGRGPLEAAVKRGNAAAAVGDPNDADRAPACCVDPDQPVETPVSPSAIVLEAIEIRPGYAITTLAPPRPPNP